ncbi:hypothetical protein [Actinocorallia herbida]|uniref:hypothetical protein n=1 Tax=Actinocorallia herbida TaxID=58109 RepID=UPI0026C153E8
MGTVLDPSAWTRCRSRAGSTRSSFASARTKVSSIPATVPPAAVLSPTATATASSSSSRARGDGGAHRGGAGTAASSTRLYKEGAADWGRPVANSDVPTGVAVFPGDPGVRRVAERENHVVRWSEFDRGGHFAAMEAPDLLVADVRASFRLVR